MPEILVNWGSEEPPPQPDKTNKTIGKMKNFFIEFPFLELKMKIFMI
jgi:hypothetical protein